MSVRLLTLDLYGGNYDVGCLPTKDKKGLSIRGTL
jgi:hypothetical protein